MTRARWAAAIVGVWLFALGWLVKREYFQSTGERLARAAFAIPPGAAYYRLEAGGQQMGFASLTVDTTLDSIRVDDVLVLEVPAAGRLRRTTARSTASLSRTMRLRSLELAYDGELGRFSARGEVEGDSVLRLTVWSAADSHTARLPYRRSAVPPSLVALRLALTGQLDPGASALVHVLDPLTLAERDVAVRVTAESTLIVADSADYDSTAMAWFPVLFDTVPAFRLVETAAGVPISSWVDGEGRIVRAQYPSGFIVDRSAFEIAYENFRRRDTARAVAASRAPPPGAVIAAPALDVVAIASTEPRVALRVRVSGGDVARLSLAGGAQRLIGDTLVIERPTGLPDQPGYRLPFLGSRDTALAPALRPEPFIESDDPRIQAQVRQILGRERDPIDATTQLIRWVHEQVDPRADGAAPAAVGVLTRRRGDANAHATLFVALARAAGLPARPVAGLLYVNDRFYHHAWAEVWLGTWIPVDPLLGQAPADAAHLRLVPGALARQLDLIRALGALKLEVL